MNPVIEILRDSFDHGDPWGSGMSAAFACAESLTFVGADVPAGLGYRPSIAGPVLESYEDMLVAEYLGCQVEMDDDGNIGDILAPTDVDPRLIEDVTRAALILDRYLDWCIAAGRDY